MAPVDSVHHEDEDNLGVDEVEESHKVFEFVAVSSFVALISEYSNEPVYILKVEENGSAEKDEQDDFKHCIPTGDLYIRGKYLKKERSRSTRVHKFSILSADALCTLDEIFDVFVCCIGRPYNRKRNIQGTTFTCWFILTSYKC